MPGVTEDPEFRRGLLKISAALLFSALCASLMRNYRHFASSPASLCLELWAFLIPMAQNGLAICFFDRVRSSSATQILSLLLSLFTFVLAELVGADLGVFVVIACVYIVWGGMFQMALVTLFEVPQMYGGLAVMFVIQMSEQRGDRRWIILYLVPIFLTLFMLLLKCGTDRDRQTDARSNQQTEMVAA